MRKKQKETTVAIKQRLAIYDEKTSPLIDFYTKKGVLVTEEVSEKINRLGKEAAEDVLNKIKNM